MSGITGMGTTFNLPNYTGELFHLTPAETPFLSSIGGLTGGGQVASTKFEWQTDDLGVPFQDVQVEGATAPTAEGRARANVENVVQIHQKKVSVSYTKQSATDQLASPSSAPYNRPAGSNPVQNELDTQVAAAIQKIGLDVNWSFINGTFANPTTNASPRKTRGLLEAITTNRILDAGAISVTGLSAATDTITEAATALVNGDAILFTSVGASTTIYPGRKYYVVGRSSTNLFKVATQPGGTPITIGTATVAYRRGSTTALTVANITSIAQMAYDNGGLSNQDAATMICNSAVRTAITTAFLTAYGQAAGLVAGSVGGVSVTRVTTDFGTMNIMLDRHVPQDTLIIASLDVCKPVFLNVPGKGVFFEEPLAKVGASEDVQIYGEIGLAYGAETQHAVLEGIKML